MRGCLGDGGVRSWGERGGICECDVGVGIGEVWWHGDLVFAVMAPFYMFVLEDRSWRRCWWWVRRPVGLARLGELGEVVANYTGDGVFCTAMDEPR